jgi:hypothetical protein
MMGTNWVALQPLPDSYISMENWQKTGSIAVHTNNNDVFVRPIESVIPLRRVEELPFEGVCSWDITNLRNRKGAYGRDQDLGPPLSYPLGLLF